MQFAKLWSHCFSDKWFLSLNCMQRGLFLQLIIYCKENGAADGRLVLASYSVLAGLFKVDRTIAANLLRAWQEAGKIKLSEPSNPRTGVLEIHIKNFKKWQGMRSGKEHVEKPTPTPKDNVPYEVIVDHLNEVTGRTGRERFKATSGDTRQKIHARWAEGYREEDFFYVNEVKAADWLGDARMDKYLQPSTLYGKTHFANYRRQRRAERLTKPNMGDRLVRNQLAALEFLKSKGIKYDGQRVERKRIGTGGDS